MNRSTKYRIAMKSVLEIAAALWALCCIGCSAEPPQTVTLGTLLREMTSADETTRWPEPFYTCRLMSSYDRRPSKRIRPGGSPTTTDSDSSAGTPCRGAP